MNNRQFDIISMAVDIELEELIAESDAAWYGERRNYGTETGNGGIGGELEGQDPRGTDEGERQAQPQEPTATGDNPQPGQVSQDQGPTRPKAANFYGAPE